MKSKGLGDTVEKFTKATGIKKLAESIPGGCGCQERKENLPFKLLSCSAIPLPSTPITLRAVSTDGT